MNLSVLSSIASLAIPPWVKPVAIAIAVAVYTAFVYVKGMERVQRQWLEATAEAARKAVAIVTKQGAVSTRTVTVYRERAAKERVVTETIIREVPVYVTAKADAACVIPRGFVFQHDRAAAGAVSGAAPGDPDAGAGVALSAVTETVVANYGTYREVAARLSACQGWIREQYQATNGSALPGPRTNPPHPSSN